MESTIPSANLFKAGINSRETFSITVSIVTQLSSLRFEILAFLGGSPKEHR